MMDLKSIILSDVSVEAKVSALAIILNKEFPKLEAKVNTVQKLKGEQGEQGGRGPQGDAGKIGKDGSDGQDGNKGKDGKDGKDGVDGVSVTDAKVDFDDSLVFTLSNGKTINVGEVKGEKGEKGERGAASMSGGGASAGFYNADGGLYNTIYGGTTALDAGGP
jgi:hypothetical protein